MSDLSNIDVIRILRKRQNCGWRAYLCHRFDCLALLEPVERNGRVLLICTTCGKWEQEAPHVSLELERQIDESRRVLNIED